jgi:hypothetical protein
MMPKDQGESIPSLNRTHYRRRALVTIANRSRHLECGRVRLRRHFVSRLAGRAPVSLVALGPEEDAMATVRYLVKDVDAALPF